MRKALKIVAIVAAVVLSVAGISLFSVYEASQQVPEFYREAISRDPDDQEQARDEFVVHATALASDLHRAGRWQNLFTAEQINAWLALELARSYPELLSGQLHDPRIAIHDNEATFACRYGDSDAAAVLSLTVEAYLHGPNVLALRIRRAGLARCRFRWDKCSTAFRTPRGNSICDWNGVKRMEIRSRSITFSRPPSASSETLRLEAVELRKDELFLAGTIAHGDNSPSPAVPQPGQTPTAGDDKPVETQPLVGAAKKETRQE